MKKYFLLAKYTWDEVFAYRLNFIMWRVRVVTQLLTIYFLWSALLQGKDMLFGYSQQTLLTYILGTSLIGSLVLSSKSADLGESISKGDLSNMLLRPIHLFAAWIARDIGDKVINVCFSVFELTLIFFLLRPPLILQTDIIYIVWAIIAVLLAIVLLFLFNLLISFIGFWSPEVWAPRFIFYILITFFAGGLFPLEILPLPVFSVFKLLPFSYLLYFPVKIYLGQLSFFTIYQGLVVAFVWILILYGFVTFIWRNGLAIYGAEGR